MASLIYQLALQFPAYRQIVETLASPNWEEPSTIFRPYLADPLRRVSRDLGIREPWVCVVDGLDEAASVDADGLPNVLAEATERLPEWLRLIVTSRPEQGLLARFRLDGVERSHLDAQVPENRADVRSFLEYRLSSLQLPSLGNVEPQQLIERIESAAAGNFLFARMTVDALLDSHPDYRLDVEDIGELPGKLEGLYHAMFRRRFSRQQEYDEIRTAGERTREALWNRIGPLLDSFSNEECENYIQHAGYKQT